MEFFYRHLTPLNEFGNFTNLPTTNFGNPLVDTIQDCCNLKTKVAVNAKNPSVRR